MSASASTPAMLATTVSALAQRLACPECSATLDSPITLSCGHTVCAQHVVSPSTDQSDPTLRAPLYCPISTCGASMIAPKGTLTAQTQTPKSPRTPAGFTTNSTTMSVSPTARRQDVTLSKILDVISRATTSLSGSPDQNRSQAESTSSPLHNELMAELSCEICFSLLYEPVITPCQHTFCKVCIQRSIDHSIKCPICRDDLPAASQFHRCPPHRIVRSIILDMFPQAYEERKASLEQEVKNAGLDIPIFICQLSFPGLPTYLHIFEPRYRLMIRRCLESSTRQFGMIHPPRDARTLNDGTHYGTMLEIRECQLLPDGRSIVETWGTYRFRILESGELDGYMVARIERIDDYPAELDEQLSRTVLNSSRPPSIRSVDSSSRPSTPLPPVPVDDRTEEQLLAVCHNFIERLRTSTPSWVIQRVNDHYGPMPSDLSTFTFWMTMILPVDDYEKSKILPIRSAYLRLRLVVHWIESLKDNWWVRSGCVIS